MKNAEYTIINSHCVKDSVCAGGRDDKWATRNWGQQHHVTKNKLDTGFFPYTPDFTSRLFGLCLETPPLPWLG